VRYPRLAATPLSQKRHPRLSQPLTSRKHRPDYLILILMSALLICGAVVVYAIGPGLTVGTDLGENFYSSKQLTAIFFGLIGFVIAALLPVERWKKYQTAIIILAIVSAIMVRFIGEEINGAHRWIKFAGFSFQTAELIKLALVLWLASFLSDRKLQGKMADINTLKQITVIIVGIILVVAGLQSDFGSAAVMVAMVCLVSFIAGLSLKKLGITVGLLIIVAVFSISFSSYRRDRVTTFLNPTADCQNEGYQACQALITIGSGGLFGKGLGRSVQAYGYLPEPANDSIFAIVAEKFGFVGAATVVGIFWALFMRIAKIAQAATTDYSRLLASGVLVWLSVQMIINVSAMVGLLPLKGITLPFVSYGGTSIIFVMIAMGIVFQISRYTDLTTIKDIKYKKRRIKGVRKSAFSRSSI
jgi:cell division protein FtsW